MRTIIQAAEHMKQIDPDSALTKTALRRLIVTGEIPSSKVGTKYLVDLDAIERFFAAAATENETDAAESAYGKIRRIEA